MNPLGPLHVYVAPAIVSALSCNVWPEQIGVFAVTFGEGGLLLTNSTTVPARLVQPLTVTVTEYVPDAAVVTEGIVGFCRAEEKEFGPLHV